MSDPVNLKALREAVANPLMHLEAGLMVPLIDPVHVAAARALLEGDRRWWCHFVDDEEDERSCRRAGQPIHGQCGPVIIVRVDG